MFHQPAAPLAAAVLCLVMAGCQAVPTPELTRFREPELTRTHEPGPPDAAPGTCWGKETSPAVVETRTEHAMTRAPEFADDGSLARPASYTTHTTTQIVKERVDTWFEVPCDDALTADLVRTLQRALRARGLYTGPVNGQMDPRTRRAVRKYQKPQGLDSGILSLAAARSLGIIAMERPAKDG